MSVFSKSIHEHFMNDEPKLCRMPQVDKSLRAIIEADVYGQLGLRQSQPALVIIGSFG